MRRPKLLWAVLALLGLGLGLSAFDGTTVTGQVSATDQEADEGYFAIGQGTMIVVKPGSGLHLWLRGRVGQRVTISLEPDSSSEDVARSFSSASKHP